jgi:speckle-type POZ protein
VPTASLTPRDLKIEGYSLTKWLGKGRFIRSETFVSAGHRWCIKYYPDGEVSHGPDWIAMQVQRDDSTDGKDIMAKLSISLLDHDGRPVALHSKIDDRFDRYRPKDSTGFIRFMKKKDLEESEYLKDDCFSIRCHFTIKNQTRTVVREPRASPSITVPPSNLHLHLLDLLRSGHGADLSLEVGGETFPTHRYIIAARSSVLMADLSDPMKGKGAPRVRIDNMEAKVFKAMLHFIYTDTLPEIGEEEIVEMAQHLLVAADRFNIERLKLICEEILCKHIRKDTAATMLALAEQRGCDGLRDACLKFLSSLDMLKAVVATDGFTHLRSSCPSILEVLVTNVAP